MAMYADDAFILATSSSLTQTQKALQNAVSSVDNQGKNQKLNRKSSKSELTFFTVSDAVRLEAPHKNGKENHTIRQYPHTFRQITVVQAKLRENSIILLMSRKLRWISNSFLEKLERMHCRGLRLVTCKSIIFHCEN